VVVPIQPASRKTWRSEPGRDLHGTIRQEVFSHEKEGLKEIFFEKHWDTHGVYIYSIYYIICYIYIIHILYEQSGKRKGHEEDINKFEKLALLT